MMMLVFLKLFFNNTLPLTCFCLPDSVVLQCYSSVNDKTESPNNTRAHKGVSASLSLPGLLSCGPSERWVQNTQLTLENVIRLNVNDAVAIVYT